MYVFSLLARTSQDPVTFIISTVKKKHNWALQFQNALRVNSVLPSVISIRAHQHSHSLEASVQSRASLGWNIQQQLPDTASTGSCFSKISMGGGAQGLRMQEQQQCSCSCTSYTLGYKGVQRLTGMIGVICQAPSLAALRQPSPKSVWEQTTVKSLAIAPVRFTRKQLWILLIVMNIPVSSTAICSGSCAVAMLQASYHIYYC